MTNHAFMTGERIAGIYLSPDTGGTILDYTGVVEHVQSRNLGYDSLTIRYASGIVQHSSAHPDFVFSMERAYRFAAMFEASVPEAEATVEAFEAVSREWPEQPGFFDTLRTLWVLEYARELTR